MGKLRDEFRWSAFLCDHPNRFDFVRAKWSLGTLAFSTYKILVAVYCLAWLIASGFHEKNGDVKWFIYVTNWAYTSLTSYFLLSSATALHYAIVVARARPCDVDVDSSTLPWVYRLQWVVQNVAYNSAICVVVLYWALVYDPTANDGRVFLDVNLHALNALFVLVDATLVASPVRIFHFVYAMLFGVVYAVFTVVYWAVGGTNAVGRPYVYPVLDYGERPGIAAACIVVSVLVGIPTIQLVLYGWFRATECVSAAAPMTTTCNSGSQSDDDGNVQLTALSKYNE